MVQKRICRDADQHLRLRFKQDRLLIKIFYVLFSISVVISTVQWLFYGNNLSLAYFLFILVQILMAMFFLMGIIAYVMRYRRGYFRSLSTAAGAVLLCLVLAAILVELDRYGYGVRFIFQPTIGNDAALLSIGNVFLMISANLLWAYLVCFGVIAVTCAFLRRDIPRLLAFIGHMDVTVRSWKNRIVVTAFSIPTIIDIKRVEIGPVPTSQTFPYDNLKRNFLLIMYFAILIPSYILLNPLFLQQSGTVDLVSLAIGTSLFIPVTIFPFSSVIDSKARAVNQGRDFELGKGFRRSIMGLLGWSTLILLFLLTVQMRSIGEIAAMYVFYLLVAVCIAMLYIYIYYNYFQNDLVNDIVKIFSKLD